MGFRVWEMESLTQYESIFFHGITRMRHFPTITGLPLVFFAVRCLFHVALSLGMSTVLFPQR